MLASSKPAGDCMAGFERTGSYGDASGKPIDRINQGEFSKLRMMAHQDLSYS